MSARGAVGKNKTCGLCGKDGHNARTCAEKETQMVVDSQSNELREETDNEKKERIALLKKGQVERKKEELKKKETSAEVRGRTFVLSSGLA